MPGIEWDTDKVKRVLWEKLAANRIENGSDRRLVDDSIEFNDILEDTGKEDEVQEYQKSIECLDAKVDAEDYPTVLYSQWFHTKVHRGGTRYQFLVHANVDGQVIIAVVILRSGVRPATETAVRVSYDGSSGNLTASFCTLSG